MTDWSSRYVKSYEGGYIQRPDTSTIGKMQQQYWVTKQAVLQKLGRKEDQHIVASDAELDAKLELFQAIEQTSSTLQKVIELYQDKLLALSQEENCMGRFLKEQGKLDKTRAGKMMCAAGKSLSYTAQQRLSLRVPLVRLYQEVETFRSRAISDTLVTVNHMENSRTEYRGALLWMKDSSQELDPDTFKQLEKFRKVQTQVRRTKTKFDKLKIDCLQKIDLLAASRCNMFSHALAMYQNSLLTFWKKTSRTMTSVADSFKGYQHYEFSMLKELTEPSKKLAEETAGRQGRGLQDAEDETEEDRLIFFEDYRDEDDELDAKKPTTNPKNKSDSVEELSRVSKLASDEKKKKSGTPTADVSNTLLDLDFSKPDSAPSANEVTNHKGPSKAEKQKSNKAVDLLTDQTDADDKEKDDMMLLNEILSMPSGADADPTGLDWKSAFGLPSTAEGFNADWQAAFGDEASLAKGSTGQDFLPSQLLDLNLGIGDLNMQRKGPIPPVSAAAANSSSSANSDKTPSAAKPMSAPSKKDKQKDMSMWFNLFADLDPLSNPDAIGKTAEDVTEQDRNC